MDDTYQEIAEALATYFDGFYEGDVDKLKLIFHPSAHLFSATDGPLQDDAMEVVYERVGGRANPADTGQQRLDRILSIHKSGAESALAKVQIAIGPKLFTDYLNLLKIDGRWQIISKIYTYVLLAEAQAAAAE
jgi:4-oxalocrotonate tautomerase